MRWKNRSTSRRNRVGVRDHIIPIVKSVSCCRGHMDTKPCKLNMHSDFVKDNRFYLGSSGKKKDLDGQ